jgi:hypothetical protein
MTSCKICHEATEDDGYGEPVHAESNRYWHGDFTGTNGHVAV